MSDSQQILEIDLDPLGYIPRPDLYVRNLSPQTITFNMGQVRWSLPPWPSEDYEQVLPWTVARSGGFERLWERQQVLVAIDADFHSVITALPEDNAPSASQAIVFRQETPQTVTDIPHNLNRSGPVAVSIFSTDGQIEYWNFLIDLVSDNVVRVSFDDPTSFIATVF